ncbi:MAG: HAD family phosphatase [Firmicutes bacterium]|nr:HAD family phosphatase [Bacillota bacterium]
MLPTQPIRLIAMDLDDTLLTDDKIISPANLQALKEAQEKGIIIIFVTGRMYGSASRYAHVLGLDVPIVTYEGGLIKTGLSHQTLFSAPLSLQAAITASRVLENHGGMNNAAVEDIFIAAQDSPIAQRYRTLHRMEVRVVGPLSRWFQSEHFDANWEIHKIIYEDDHQNILKAQEDLNQHADILNITRSYPEFLEIGPVGINKGFAVNWLADYYNIPPEEIMVIGDGGNDIDMFKAAGFSVCMANGQELAKEHAHYVGKSNQEDGVADAIYRFALKTK